MFGGEVNAVPDTSMDLSNVSEEQWVALAGSVYQMYLFYKSELPRILIGVLAFGMAIIFSIERADEEYLENSLKWKLRQDAGWGSWACLLLPTAVIVTNWNGASVMTDKYNIAMVTFSVFIQVSSMATLCGVTSFYGDGSKRKSHMKHQPGWFWNAVLLCHPVLWFLYIPVTIFLDFSYSFLVVVSVHFILLSALQLQLPRLLPHSFTYGEMTIVCQGIVYFSFTFSCQMLHRAEILQFENYVGPKEPQIVLFMQMAVLPAGLVVLLLHVFPAFRCSVGFYALVAGLALGFAFPVLAFAFQENSILWLINYIISTKSKIYFFIYWTVSCGTAAALVIWQSIYPTNSSQTVTIIRKYFHFLSVAVFVPGLLWEPEMLCVASACALVVFVMLECMRILKVEPFGQCLDSSFHVFIDSQDSGVIILTHIYLLIGCSAALWLNAGNLQSATHLSLYSGVISVGMGDTAASVIGTRFGRHKWPGTKKTIEGTLGAVIFQLIGCFVLSYIGMPLSWPKQGIGVVITVVLTSLLEAFTTQIDNLILPLSMYTTFALLR